jgi:hypothetical protein
MNTQSWAGVPYLPVAKEAPKAAPWSVDGIAMVIVFSISAILMVMLGAAHYADRRNPARDKARAKLRNAKIPAYVLTSRENMKLWLKVHFGVEPQPWQIELLECLRDARIAAFRRANVGKGQFPIEYMLKQKDEDDSSI